MAIYKLSIQNDKENIEIPFSSTFPASEDISSVAQLQGPFSSENIQNIFNIFVWGSGDIHEHQAPSEMRQMSTKLEAQTKTNHILKLKQKPQFQNAQLRGSINDIPPFQRLSL